MTEINRVGTQSVYAYNVCYGGPAVASKTSEGGAAKNMASVYVLKSCKDNCLYIGSTRGLVENGIIRHNNGGIKSTRYRLPFVLLYSEEFVDYIDARKRELYFKTGSGRESLKRILVDRVGTQVAKGGRL